MKGLPFPVAETRRRTRRFHRRTSSLSGCSWWFPRGSRKENNTQLPNISYPLSYPSSYHDKVSVLSVVLRDRNADNVGYLRNQDVDRRSSCEGAHNLKNINNLSATFSRLFFWNSWNYLLRQIRGKKVQTEKSHCKLQLLLIRSWFANYDYIDERNEHCQWRGDLFRSREVVGVEGSNLKWTIIVFAYL